jgi:hypothetical protein
MKSNPSDGETCAAANPLSPSLISPSLAPAAETLAHAAGSARAQLNAALVNGRPGYRKPSFGRGHPEHTTDAILVATLERCVREIEAALANAKQIIAAHSKEGTKS